MSREVMSTNRKVFTQLFPLGYQYDTSVGWVYKFDTRPMVMINESRFEYQKRYILIYTCISYNRGGWLHTRVWVAPTNNHYGEPSGYRDFIARHGNCLSASYETLLDAFNANPSKYCHTLSDRLEHEMLKAFIDYGIIPGKAVDDVTSWHFDRNVFNAVRYHVLETVREAVFDPLVDHIVGYPLIIESEDLSL